MTTKEEKKQISISISTSCIKNLRRSQNAFSQIKKKKAPCHRRRNLSSINEPALLLIFVLPPPPPSPFLSQFSRDNTRGAKTDYTVKCSRAAVPDNGTCLNLSQTNYVFAMAFLAA